MGHSYNGQERRKFARFSKNYSLLFNIKGSEVRVSDTTFIKDISKSGLRFTTSQFIEPGTHLVFEIGVPYIAPNRLILEGVVISCSENTPRLIYEIRAEFSSLNIDTIKILTIIENRNIKGL